MKKALIYASVASMIQQFNMNNIRLLLSLNYQVDVACNFEFGSTITTDKIEQLKSLIWSKYQGQTVLYDEIVDNYIDSSTLGAVITVGAAGVDTLAEWWAKKHKLEWICYLPNYKIFGRAAPLKRDEDMVKASDKLIAFWDGQSTGTKYTIDFARKLGKRVEVHLIYDW